MVFSFCGECPLLQVYLLHFPGSRPLLLELGRREQAHAAELRALSLTGNQAEQSLLRQRLSGHGPEADMLPGVEQPCPPRGGEIDERPDAFPPGSSVDVQETERGGLCQKKGSCRKR